MSTFFTDINAALRVRLSTLPSSPPIAWENFDYEPDSDQLYLRPTWLPADTVQSCLGDSGLDDNQGLFQIDVFIPDGDGRSTWPDQIADWFRRGIILEQNQVRVRVRNTSVSVAQKDENFYIVPVTVNYQAFTEART